jgi:hypothetical protein
MGVGAGWTLGRLFGKLAGCMTIIFLGVVVITVIGIFSSHDKTEPAVIHRADNAGSESHQNVPTTDPPGKTAVAADPTPTYSTGQDFTVGDWAYNVSSTGGWAPMISGIGARVVMPDAAFLLLDITVRNEDRSAGSWPPFKLLDSEDREYDQSSKGIFLINPFGVNQSLNLATTLNPGVSRHGYAIFDVPRDRQYRLLVSGGYLSGKSALVAFFSQSPEADAKSKIQAAEQAAERHEFATAENLYKQVLEVEPNNVDVEKALASVLYREDKLTESAAVLDKLPPK